MGAVGEKRQRVILTEEDNGNPKQVEARKEKVGTTLFNISITQVNARTLHQAIPSSYRT